MSGAAESAGRALRLGLLVPARNEALVIERKLRNLARVRWPAGEHRLVVVDDESTDGTGERARRLCAELFAEPRADGAVVRSSVVSNDVHPGKAGAIARGLRELGGAADIAVLTDADVLIDGEALPELSAAFEREPGLGMACGAQVFLDVVAADGSWPDVAGAGPAAGLYDRITAAIRRFESRFGALFSVHGQLLAWRMQLGLAPTIGIAADDIDLMLQARHAGACVRLVEGARFFELKSDAGPLRDEQALRRARAYIQVIRAHRNPFGEHWKARAQWAFYRRMPLAAGRYLPYCVPFAWTAGIWLALYMSWRPPMWAIVVWGIIPIAWSSAPAAKRMRNLLHTIDRARRLERNAKLSDRWEMRRA